MTEPTHRVIADLKGGKRLDLKPREVAKVKKEWKEADKEIVAKKLAKEAKRDAKMSLLKKLKITEDEAKLLLED